MDTGDSQNNSDSAFSHARSIIQTFYPSTPATRLPLPELTGNSEEGIRTVQKTLNSPDEHIVWHCRRSPSDRSARQTPANQKQRKRARSSSPLGGDLGQDSCYLPNNEIFDLHRLQTTLKTPRADPAADIWTRYSVKKVEERLLENKENVEVNNLIEKSSPHNPSFGSIGKSGLRRWSSCGMQWPKSKPKRRKTSNHFGENQNVITKDARLEDLGAADQSESKVEVLLEKVQATLATNASGVGTDGFGSPLEVLDSEKSGTPSAETLAAPEPALSNQISSPLSKYERDVKRSEKNLSYQPDTIENFTTDKASKFGHKFREISKSREAFDSGSCQDLPKEFHHSYSEYGSSLQPKDDLSSDEFDLGGDEDGFANDLENLAALYDSQPMPQTKAPRREEISSETLQEHHPCSYKENNIAGRNDEFECSDIDDDQLAAVELVATQRYKESHSSQKASSPKHSVINRYIVQKKYDGNYINERGRNISEKVLILSNEASKIVYAATLRGSWGTSEWAIGDRVQIVGEFTNGGQCLIDDNQNMIILNPDIQVSATDISDTVDCMRRAVLKHRVKATDSANPAQIYGNVLHLLLQESMKENRWDEDWFHGLIKRFLPRYYDSMLEIDLGLKEANDFLMSKVSRLQHWAASYLSDSNERASSSILTRAGDNIKMSISKLLDIEEHVQSPILGLKGNIDATVEITIENNEELHRILAPLEFKTGHRNDFKQRQHESQTALYTLLLSERYDTRVSQGILMYLDSLAMHQVPSLRLELVHMLTMRNELVRFLQNLTDLPPMLAQKRSCIKCYTRKTCFLYHNLAEGGPIERLLPEARIEYDGLVERLDDSDRRFFVKWDDLLSKEERSERSVLRELALPARHRERLGRCISALRLKDEISLEEDKSSRINRYQYSFTKANATQTGDFANLDMAIGDPIMISDDNGHFGLAKGFIKDIQEQTIMVNVDRRLGPFRNRTGEYDELKSQTFVGIKDYSAKPPTSHIMRQGTSKSEQSYRLDKDIFSSGMARARRNLIQFMDDSNSRSKALRDLIVRNTAPKFRSQKKLPKLDFDEAGELNDNQRAAIQNTVNAEDYVLILGMPGTGKTTTIAHIIRALVKQGKSVLLSSYTHSAVDNILLKIRNDKFPMLRLGALSKVHPEVRKFACLTQSGGLSLEGLRKLWTSAAVVATTCLGMDDKIFSQRSFDYCIIDEASQITLPICLGPIRMAETFVLVGDHHQLPPVVKCKDALVGGLEHSLFKLLCEQRPEAVVNLEIQYRMSADIMRLSNRLVYHGRLQCGNALVANRVLEIPKIDGFAKYHDQVIELANKQRITCSGMSPKQCYLRHILQPQHRVVFLDTDRLRPLSLEQDYIDRKCNSFEVTLVHQIASALLAAGIAPDDVGVVTPYRSQLELIRTAFRNSGVDDRLESCTADRYQGRDKEVIIVSMVRSNSSGNVGDLLKDWRRVNVALTRARSKLIIIGNAKTIGRGSQSLNKLVRICTEENWLKEMTMADVETHDVGVINKTQVFGAGPSVCYSHSPDETSSHELLDKTVKCSPSVQSRAESKVGRPPLRNTGRGLKRVALGNIVNLDF